MSLTFISAGAGSGKTYTLTQTLGKLLNEGSVRPAGVIATTFTKKAATELRERVRQYLLEEGEFTLANAMGQARIGTVNSVCGSLLERFAFEAGMPTQQQVIEDSQAVLLIREAIDAAMTGTEVAELSRLAARLGIESWMDEVKALVMQARANDIAPTQLAIFAEKNADDLLSYFPKQTKRDLTQELLAAIDQTLPSLQTAAESSTVKKTKDALRSIEQFRRKLAGGYASWSDWIKISKDGVPEKGLLLIVEPIQLIIADCAAHPKLHSDIRNYLIRIFAVCGDALSHYRQRKLDLGVVDFTDQEHLLLKLLDQPEVAEVLREELDLLLVDEFQDTSPIQLALFLKLSQLSKHTYWVGDIKQAIYGFRGSDTALMQAILKSLPALGGDKQVLDNSWRSRPALVNLVNAIFTKAFADTLPPEEIILKPKRPEALNTPAFANWHLNGKNVGQIANALATGVQELILSGMQIPDSSNDHSRPIEAQDIAILCYSHAAIANLASSLREIGIPVAISRPGLLATPEAKLAQACLRRLNDSSDTIATAEIISLADCAEPESWLTDRLVYLADGKHRTQWRESGDNAHPLVAKIASLRSELPLLAPREALQRVIAAGQLAVYVLAWQQDPAIARSRLGNLEALINLATQYEDNCRGTRRAATISGLLLWLDEQAENEADTQAEPAVNAVRILTHHSAKGLEWPVVILTDLDKEIQDQLWGISATSTTPVNAINPLENRFIRYWPWPFGKQQNGIIVKDQIDSSEIAQRFAQSAEAEARRLLYVSMTRAREMLILARKGKAKQEAWLETLGAEWLDNESNEADKNCLNLPNGERITTDHQEFPMKENQETQPAVETPLYWFPQGLTKERQPLNCNPSLLPPGDYKIDVEIAVGQRMKILAGAEWDVLGTAIHACLATSFTDPEFKLKVTNIDHLLRNFGVQTQINSMELLGQIEALHTWLDSQWPNHKALAEIPITAKLTNGQFMNGRIDLLLETSEGFILIDHKSFPGGTDQFNKLAQSYGGQLAAYAAAINHASKKQVIEQWIFLPVSAGALKINN